MIENIMLSGKNILLKILNKKDVTKDYLDWLNDPLINKFLEVRLNPPATIQDLIIYVEDHAKLKNSFLFGMYTAKMELIGTLRLHDINNYHQFAYVGIMIGNKKFHGKGFGKEALDLISKHSKETLGLNYLYAGCYENNKASFNCFINSGFKKECVIKDYWLFEANRVSQLMLKKELN